MNMMDLTMIKITPDNVSRIANYKIIKEYSFVLHHFKRILFLAEYLLIRH